MPLLYIAFAFLLNKSCQQHLHKFTAKTLHENPLPVAWQHYTLPLAFCQNDPNFQMPNNPLQYFNTKATGYFLGSNIFSVDSVFGIVIVGIFNITKSLPLIAIKSVNMILSPPRGWKVHYSVTIPPFYLPLVHGTGTEQDPLRLPGTAAFCVPVPCL